MRETSQIAEILLAAYNGEKYICAQIDSILAQKDERWHLTISDDGSTDGTPSIIDEYVQRYPQRISRYCSGKRFGNARDHFFHLMQVCDAPYMLFCDQDDVWYPQKVGKVLDAMIREERQHGKDMPVLAFTDQTPTDEQLRPLAPSLMRYQQQFFERFDYRSILMQNVVTGGAMGINRALADMAGHCGDSSQTIMHDWWLAVVAARFGQVVYIDEPLSDYRQHGSNSVGAKDVHSIDYIRSVMSNLAEMKRRVQAKKGQAAVFFQTFEKMLTQEDKLFLKGFIKKRSGAAFFIRYSGLIHGFSRLAGMILLG